MASHHFGALTKAAKRPRFTGALRGTCRHFFAALREARATQVEEDLNQKSKISHQHFLAALLLGGVVGLGLFTLAYAEAASYLSDDPAACVNCHIMRDMYEAWNRGSHQAVATCNDCHIPHTFPEKYLVKALNGFNHSRAFTLQDFPEPIRITDFNRGVTLNNCRQCHAAAVEMIDYAGQSEPEDCLRCHATVGHDQNSAGKP